MGAFRDSAYERGVIRPKQGDLILFFTDGLTEATNKEDREFDSQDDLADLFVTLSSESPSAIVQEVRARLDSFREIVPLSDDLTIAALKFTSFP